MVKCFRGQWKHNWEQKGLQVNIKGADWECEDGYLKAGICLSRQ